MRRLEPLVHEWDGARFELRVNPDDDTSIEFILETWEVDEFGVRIGGLPPDKSNYILAEDDIPKLMAWVMSHMHGVR